ncbi:tumor necrosis factor alpha-induced protein 8-like protein isoform X1 [Sitophilus oryzae]|uniref:Tumor necrosis factor alpha-induced protein 8-like protein isoform X1 n=2 Tax=Sitophilus oryzae TaxID=7048 RepID=A0A6J2XYY1_SITOR|nr:tumor necrosis factor alpha-induced protein 8-like protein isoform X1 [Sitophilus oryzae]
MTTIVELESWLIYQCIATECSNCLFMTESTFKARDIGLRAQKKILSRMAGKNIAKVFIDDVTASLLDNLYRLAKQYSNNKKEAEKLIKNIIKIVIKLGVLHKNNLLSEEDLKQAEKFKNKFRMAGMTIISFYEVDFSYDRNYLVQALEESRKTLQSIISKHLTDKSMARVDSVFSFFGNEYFLDAIFRRDSDYREALGRVVNDLNKAIENGDL